METKTHMRAMINVSECKFADTAQAADIPDTHVHSHEP